MNKLLRRIGLPVLSALLVVVLIAAGTLHRLDRWVQDWLYQQRGATSGEIVIIGIDEKTLAELGPYSPAYRKYMAGALQMLSANPDKLPAAVCIDILYEGESDEKTDAQLAAAAEKLGCVITASMVEFGDVITWENGHAVERNAAAAVNYVEPYESLRNVTVQGHINAMSDMDGILRHALLYVTTPSGNQVLSMAASAARLYLEKKGLSLPLPSVNAGGHYYVSFTGKPGDFYDGFSLYGLLMGNISPEAWAGKIVLIGPYAASLQDQYFTAASKAEPMYGIEYQANVIQSLLAGNLKTEAEDPIQLAVLAVFCIAASWIFFRRKIWIGGAVCGGLVLLGFLVAWICYLCGWVVHVLWLPVAALVLYLASMLYHHLLAARERRALALEKERIATELSLATRIQSSFLPKTFPDRPEFRVFASMDPAKEVGGDLYDIFQIDDDHLCLVIGDVSGKGVPAALFMMLAAALIHHVAMRDLSPAKILTEVNAEVVTRNPEEMFVTVWLGVLELSSGILTAASAGHEYPAVKPPDGSFDLFKDKHGFVIGGMEGVRYREYTLPLQPGSKVFVYTDGVAEATDSSNQLYGTDRMIEALREKENGTPEEILAAVNHSVNTFVGKAPQFDDLTMLCVEYCGPAAPPPAQDSP
jgi:serine phosphatase RsbU (regulator of sigma subunit)